MVTTPPTTRLTDPRALRAYAHPVRLALVALLRAEGPQTATQAAAAIGESVPSCSFHLRQLAKYGVIEQAGGGHGREKPWRATALVTEWEPGQPAAAEALGLALAEQYFDFTRRWLRTRHTEPEQWQEAALFGDSLLHLTAAELKELGGRIAELIAPYAGRLANPAARPDGTRAVAMLHLAFPARLNSAAGD